MGSLARDQVRRNFQHFSAICLCFLLEITGAHALAITDVLVNESLGGVHHLTDEGTPRSSANLSFLLGTSQAAADLETGTLKTYVQTSTSDVAESSGAIVTAYAELNDLFTLAGIDAPTVVFANLAVTGYLVTPPRDAFSHYSGVFAGLGPDVKFQRQLDPFPDGGEDNISVVLTAPFVAHPGVPFNVQARLQSFGHGFNHFDILSDFSSTATLSFSLPVGTSISSQGGFLQSAVPLPAAFLLFASGLAGLTRIRSFKGAAEAGSSAARAKKR